MDNSIYTRKSFSANIYLFKVNNRNTSKLTVKISERLSILLLVNFGYILYLLYLLYPSSVSAVGFEQVNVFWVSSYRFVNVKITCFCNYWHMYQNLNEIVTDKKRLLSKVVVPNHFFLVGYCVYSQRTVYFSDTVFPYFAKIFAVIHSSMDMVLFRRALAAMNCVYTMYLTYIWVNLQFQF